MPDPNHPAPPNVANTSLKALTEVESGALDPEDSVHHAGKRMREHDTSKWPVARDRKLVGMINRKNPDWEMSGKGHDPDSWKVGQIMSHDLVFCYEDEECASAQRLMEERGLNYLPVVDREMRVVGIFSREEIQAQTQASAAEAAPSET